MESNTTRSCSSTRDGIVFELGSLYSYFDRIKDKRKPKGLRYPLAVILTLIVLAKLCGQDRPSGIAEWAQNRAELLAKALHLKRAKMPHHSTYRRILEDVINMTLTLFVLKDHQSKPITTFALLQNLNRKAWLNRR